MYQIEKFNSPYNPSTIEDELRKFWQSNGFYAGRREPSKKAYTIVIPPPNITGDLTMGHMINNTLQDMMIRWARANGKSACWIPGVDHASIATEAKVTALLTSQGVDKKEIGREKFLGHVWEWKEKYANRITDRLKWLGVSVDWNRFVFTMDDNYSRAVFKAFVTLYKRGLVYKGHRLVNWCPKSQSVISDEEVLPEERNGHLWHIRYQLEDGSGHLTVATTRPETLLGDLALAVNPSDERYAKLVGKKVMVPICNRLVPIVADHYVEKDFGTGVVKITPAHDMNDFEVGQRHNLGLLNIMNPDASLNDNVPESYRGLDRFDARKKLVAELDATGFLEKVEPYRLTIGISERGQVPIEYYLSDQWYISMKPLAELALDATRSKRLHLHPAHQEKTWEHWLTNIKDWCVSRQLWWGHRLPIYYCKSCNHVMCEEQAPISCEKCRSTQLEQDSNVLDTWASSWLWPFGVHNWANPTEEQQQDLAYFYPTDLIVTGPDIIFFWIARMVMAGEYFTGKTPFRDVYFTPMIRDDKGRKMSKSLGNSPDPKDLIEQYGTDAMRFTLINQIVLGQDIYWADESCLVGRHFANKIWNCTRFLLMNCDKLNVNPAEHSFEQLPQNNSDALTNWISAEFFEMVRRAHEGISTFNFSQYSSSAYEFVWMVYCDWFVELMKPRLSESTDPKLATATLQTALCLFDGVLRILHPLMPYVTEEIWQALAPDQRGKQTIGFQSMPTPNPARADIEAIHYMREVQAVVGSVRTIRGQFNIHPGTELKVVINDSAKHFGNLVPMMEFLSKACFAFQENKPRLAAASLANGREIYVDIDGLVDLNAERERIDKKLIKLEQTLTGIEKKLQSEQFVNSAPKHIVDGAREQQLLAQKEIKTLRDNLAALGETK